jgi:RNA recognition motif-containing protein
MNLFVGNLSRDVTEVELRELFEPFGKLASVSIVKDKFSGVSKGFAFVEMPVKEEAEAAIAGLYRKQLKGQSMDVTEARPREARKSGPGGRGGGKRRSW